MAEREPGQSPQRDLWQSVLLVTIQDALYGPAAADVSHKIARTQVCAQARHYLTQPSDDLAEVCGLAGIDMQALIDRLRPQIAAAPSPEELAETPGRKTVAKPRVRKPKPVPFRDQQFTIDGETRSAADWCNLHGVRLTTAQARLRQLGWPAERAFTLAANEARSQANQKSRQSFNPSVPRRKRSASESTPRFEHNGESLTLTEWSERSGIKKGTLAKRLHDGWSFAEAISTPARRKAA